ncbi:MAG: hypothetical protein KIT17_15415 [Rubrivivax sp.]|nr:hypothetical protein [Rubrivivax sp.]
MNAPTPDTVARAARWGLLIEPTDAGWRLVRASGEVVFSGTAVEVQSKLIAADLAAVHALLRRVRGRAS